MGTILQVVNWNSSRFLYLVNYMPVYVTAYYNVSIIGQGSQPH